MCQNGHLSQKKLDHIKSGRGCKQCRGIYERKDFDTVKIEAEKLGITILSDSYDGAHLNMPVICERGHYGEKSWHSIRKGQGCMQCSIENKNGEGNPNYNPNLTDDMRLKQRSTPEYYLWRKEVHKKCNYTCCCCKIRGGNLIAHHILNYAEHEDLQTDALNGVSMCDKDHSEFHKIYGRKNNTKEQLDAFILAQETYSKTVKEEQISLF